MVFQTVETDLVTLNTPGPLDVRVTGGVIRGIREGGVLAWRGIPYAAPPVGDLRFRARQPEIPWIGVRDATRFGKVAPQVYRGQFKGAGPRTPPAKTV